MVPYPINLSWWNEVRLVNHNGRQARQRKIRYLHRLGFWPYHPGGTVPIKITGAVYGLKRIASRVRENNGAEVA